MLDKIISSFKGEAGSQLVSKFGLGPDKANDAVDLAKDNIAGGLKSEAAKGNFSGIKELLNGQVQGNNSGILNNITNSYIGSLTSKLNLSPSQSSSIGNFIIPFIFQKIGNKTGGQSLDKEGILGMLGGGNIMDKIPGGIGDKLGGMFGK